METSYSHEKQNKKTKKRFFWDYWFFFWLGSLMWRRHSEVWCRLNALKHATIQFLLTFEIGTEKGIQKNKIHLQNFLSFFSAIKRDDYSSSK